MIEFSLDCKTGRRSVDSSSGQHILHICCAINEQVQLVRIGQRRIVIFYEGSQEKESHVLVVVLGGLRMNVVGCSIFAG